MPRRKAEPVKLTPNKPADSPELLLQMGLAGFLDHWADEDRAVVETVPVADRRAFLLGRYQSRLSDCERLLKENFAKLDTHNFLAFVAMAAQTRLTNDPDSSPIQAAHVELAQFLGAKYGYRAVGAPPSLDLYSHTIRLIREYVYYYQLHASPAFGDGELQDEQLRRAAYVTSQYFAGARNWAAPQKVESLLIAIGEPLENKLKNETGLTMTSIVKLWRTLRDTIYQRLAAFQTLRFSDRLR